MSMPDQIQAIRIHAYGEPSELKLEQIPLPQPESDEVLVRVLAAGVNPIDWKIIEGLLKDFMPLQFPYIPGSDIAGIIEAVGSDVTTFQKGQAVFGTSSNGGYTEYTTANSKTLALKPESLHFDEAATIAVGATTAWQALFDQGNLQPGQTVLIQGASGGVGLFAVQFAHGKGAHVIATTSTANVDYVRSLGADTIIDYTSTLVEHVVHDVDLVFDAVGQPTLPSSLAVLKHGGTLVTIAAQPDESQIQDKQVQIKFFSAQVSRQLLESFAKLIKDDQLKVTIERVFPLVQAAQALEQSRSGHGRGRIVLHVADQ